MNVIPPAPDRIIIRIEDLHGSFGEKKVLRGVNLEIRQGEILVIIGRSGCGKSVLLKHIVGLLRPESGRLFVGTDDVARASEKELNRIRRRMGMLFQGSALFDSMDVLHNVGFLLYEHTETPEAEIRRIVADSLEMVGLKGIESLMPSELSGGMKKRVALARAIIMHPEVILYDEHTTGLDPITADAINDLILDLRSRLGATGVAVTHDMASAYKIADRIAMLHEGRILEIGTVEAIRATQNPYVRQFINGSAQGPIQLIDEWLAKRSD